MKEWTRFQKCARRMRALREDYSNLVPSPEVFSAIQLRTINEPLFPNLKSLRLSRVEKFIPFLPLFLPPRITSIDLNFGPNFPKGVVASTVTTFPKLCPNLQMIGLYSVLRDPMITAAASELLLVINRSTPTIRCRFPTDGGSH